MSQTIAAMHTRATEGEDGLVRFTASNESVDRYGSIIRQHWQLDAFNRNPLFLWMHDYKTPPIGRVASFDAADGESEAAVKFADTPFASEVRGLYLGGFLNAVSVGFMPGEVGFVGDVVVYGSENDPNELYELSGVTVPGNAEALARAIELELAPTVRGWLEVVAESVLGRTPDAEDLQLIAAGADANQIEQLRSINDKLDRLLLLETEQKQPQAGDGVVLVLNN